MRTNPPLSRAKKTNMVRRDFNVPRSPRRPCSSAYANPFRAKGRRHLPLHYDPPFFCPPFTTFTTPSRDLYDLTTFTTPPRPLRATFQRIRYSRHIRSRVEVQKGTTNRRDKHERPYDRSGREDTSPKEEGERAHLGDSDDMQLFILVVLSDQPTILLPFLDQLREFPRTRLVDRLVLDVAKVTRDFERPD